MHDWSTIVRMSIKVSDNFKTFDVCMIITWFAWNITSKVVLLSWPKFIIIIMSRRSSKPSLWKDRAKQIICFQAFDLANCKQKLDAFYFSWKKQYRGFNTESFCLSFFWCKRQDSQPLMAYSQLKCTFSVRNLNRLHKGLSHIALLLQLEFEKA